MQNHSQGRRDRFDPKPAAPAEEATQSEDQVVLTEERPVDAPVSAEPQVGIVTNCVRLNVRKEPKASAEVVAIIDLLSEVVVDMDTSTDAFYKVCTAAGIEGFCVKEYIALRR